ncbi:MAG: hypothetical protein GY711_19995 [bacterium]|nr:hypothetical protein [bacterium]
MIRHPRPRLPRVVWAALGLLASSSAAGQVPPLAPQAPSDPRQGAHGEGWTQCYLEELAAPICERLEALRGLAFKHEVRVVRVEPAIFQVLAQSAAERDRGAWGPAADAIAAKLMGLVDGEVDLDALRIETLGRGEIALYDRDERACYVNEDAPLDVVRLVLAHELALALDEQYKAPRSDGPLGNSDALFAERAASSAVGLELVARWIRTQPEGADLERARAAIPDEWTASSPWLVWKPMVAEYAQGRAFLRRQGRPTVLGAPAHVRDLNTALAAPPRSSEQVLHPSKYWNPEKVDEPRSVSVSTEDLDETWSVTHEDTLGELGCAFLTTPFDERGDLDVSPLGLLGLRFTNRAAAGWGGDRYVLLEREGAALLAASTVWDSERDADEFLSALEQITEDIEAAQKHIAGYASSRVGFDAWRVGPDEVRFGGWVGLSSEAARSALAQLAFE